MAITTDDFNKVWASTSPLTPYSFSESQYKEGWNFIGGTPPSRQMWDFLQKQNDEKSKFLLDKFGEYLPLSGGTMTGDTLITMGNGESYVRNWSNGLYLGGTYSSNASRLVLFTNSSANGFQLEAGDGTTFKRMDGKPDGTLTWDNKEIERVNSSSLTHNNGYIRYESGLQICWNTITVNKQYSPGAYDKRTWTYPVAFNQEPIVLCNSRHDRFNVGTNDGTIGNSSCTIYSVNDSTDGAAFTLTHIDCFAIGKWK